MNIDARTPIGQLAAAHPLATRVFARHAIDFCCGGGQPLVDVCRTKGLDADRVLAEIAAELSDDEPRDWTAASNAALIDHILTRYHATLREELPRLEAMARKVLRVHGDKDPERLGALVTVFLGLKAELEEHLEKEEVILFPAMAGGDLAQHALSGPVGVMLREHSDAGAALQHLRTLTDGYAVPPGACNTWAALWHGLAALERDLHEHIHLENNILFPRATGALGGNPK